MVFNWITQITHLVLCQILQCHPTFHSTKKLYFCELNKFWLMLNFAICLTTWKWLTCNFYEMIQVFFTPSPWASYITHLLPKQRIFHLVNEYEINKNVVTFGKKCTWCWPRAYLQIWPLFQKWPQFPAIIKFKMFRRVYLHQQTSHGISISSLPRWHHPWRHWRFDVINCDVIGNVICNNSTDLAIKITFFGCHGNKLVSMKTGPARCFPYPSPTSLPSLVQIGP